MKTIWITTIRRYPLPHGDFCRSAEYIDVAFLPINGLGNSRNMAGALAFA